MKYLVIDTETSGLPNYALPADHADQPWLAELAMIRVDEDLNIEAEHAYLVKPDGWVLSEEAAAVNGLSMQRLEEDGLPLRLVLEAYTAAIREGRAVVAHNAQHDCKIMRGSLRRTGMDDLYAETPNYCTMRKATGYVVKADGKRGWPKLSDACAHFKIPQPEKHSALADATACLEVLRWLRKLGIAIDPQVHPAPAGEKVSQTELELTAKPKDPVPY